MFLTLVEASGSDYIGRPKNPPVFIININV